MKLEIGGTYELYTRGPSFPEHSLVVHILAECVAKTVRFKEEAPGYRLLVLSKEGVSGDTVPGGVYEWVEDANIFRRAKRLA